MPQLEKMRPGSRIVAHEFPLPGVRPTRMLRFPVRPTDLPARTKGQPRRFTRSICGRFRGASGRTWRVRSRKTSPHCPLGSVCYIM